MSSKPEAFLCSACGNTELRWVGRCPSCDQWNTLVEVGAVLESSGEQPHVVQEVSVSESLPYSTGLAEVDRVLGGGLIPGSVTLVAGTPGVGKSTMCLHAAVNVGSHGVPTLVIAAEESESQVATRARRLGSLSEHVSLMATASLGDALRVVSETTAKVVVVDSVSTMVDQSLRSPSGGVTQVRAAAEQLAAIARKRGIALVLVGHVTKDGDIAGPRALEHLVDTVVYIEGDRHHQRRVVTTTKHRFGPSGEVGLLEMGPQGLTSIDDPSAALVAERGPALPGSVATVLAEGTRPLVVEIQALVTPAVGTPARVAQGVSATRLRQLAAVLDAHCDVGLVRADLFVACSGAVRATEPAVDLAVIAAALSAFQGHALDPGVVCIGEVGLTGSIKGVAGITRRLEEAARVGLVTAVAPPGSTAPEGMRLISVATVAELLDALVSLRDTKSDTTKRPL